jgi:hypothetical protein
VNAGPEVSNLTRIDPAALLGKLPKARVRLADNLDEVEAYVSVGRSGRELYPWAMALVAIVWGAEHVLANRFYRRPPNEKKTDAPSQIAALTMPMNRRKPITLAA